MVPPRVAVTQAVVVPIPNAKLSAEQHAAIAAKAADIHGALAAAGVRTHLDDRDNYTPGWKYNHWELKARPHSLPLIAPCVGSAPCGPGAICFSVYVVGSSRHGPDVPQARARPA